MGLKFINSLDHFFRYVLTGVTALLFFYLSHPSCFKDHSCTINYWVAFALLFSPLIGMVIFSFHRVLFELIDLAVYRFDVERLGNITAHQFRYFDDKMWNWSLLKSATLHYYFIVDELIVVFLLFNESSSLFNIHSGKIIIFLLVSLLIGFVAYFFNIKLRERLVDILMNARSPNQ